ncbi:MAG: glycosyltransferase [Betaproteobacteria bacterium]
MSEHKVEKLVFMISSLRDSGPVNALLEILKIFSSRESFNNIELVTLRPLSENDLSVRFQELNINIHQLSFLQRSDGKGRSLLSVFQLIRILRGGHVVSAGIRADFISALLSLVSKFRRFSILMNVPHDEFQFMFGRFIGGVVARLQYWLFKRFAFNVVCCSTSLKIAISTRLPDNVPRSVIYNPLLVDVTMDSKIIDKQNIVVIASVLNQRKNVVEALAMSKAYLSPLGNSIHIFGVGDELLKLQNQVLDEEDIIFKGYSNDLLEELGRSKILVSSSLSEGLPLAVQLAILQRCICILSNIPAHQELRNLGKSVILYDLGCRDSFKSAVATASSLQPKDLDITRERLLYEVDHDTILKRWIKVMEVSNDTL